MKNDIQRICDKYITYRKAKSKVLLYCLYTSLSVPKEPWVNISMNFILDLLRLK